MTLEEILKAQGLADEQIAAIMSSMKENKIYTTNEENIDIRYNKLKIERDDLKEKLETADNTIADLKKNNKDNEELQKTIKTHETTIATMKKDYEDKIREMNIQSAIRSKLTDTKYPELLETKFDKTKLSVAEDGTVLGIDEQLAVLKEQYKDLFVPVIKGRDPNNIGGNPPGIKNPWSKEHFNLTEQGKILKEDPELAKQLMASTN
ncbi:phage scaffolding protein [Clostridium sp. Cult2]|uniref:phage scaffolding protein n=1 Tax=Clostridium sp. Cult2 TaxID=2079003 RepID=UPI001F273D61|nr:phage scaffolding protein [Clostridium sp. Cult2]MCF6466353.1 hypothetical protein [Clostridium sp. Cult2]